MPAQKHVHTYVQYKKRPGYFRCAAPDCTHFIDRESVHGKQSVCTQCGATFILDYPDLKRVKPRCINCSDTKKARVLRKAQELTRYLGTDSFGTPGVVADALVEDLDFSDQPFDFSSFRETKEPEPEELEE